MYKKLQEDTLYEIAFVKRLLGEGSAAQAIKYLNMAELRYKNGLASDEIDAVLKRAEDASKEAREQ